MPSKISQNGQFPIRSVKIQIVQNDTVIFWSLCFVLKHSCDWADLYYNFINKYIIFKGHELNSLHFLHFRILRKKILKCRYSWSPDNSKTMRKKSCKWHSSPITVFFCLFVHLFLLFMSCFSMITIYMI